MVYFIVCWLGLGVVARFLIDCEFCELGFVGICICLCVEFGWI